MDLRVTKKESEKINKIRTAVRLVKQDLQCACLGQDVRSASGIHSTCTVVLRGQML